MYVPIRDWMKENFPICDMYKFVTCSIISLTEGIRQVNYFLKAELYFDQYLLKSDNFKKIHQYLNLRPEEDKNWNSSWQMFRESTNIELKANSREEGVMTYVRFLEGVKEREIALISEWMDKALSDKASLAYRAAKTADKAQKLADEKKDLKARNPKAIEAEMMRAMGLEDGASKKPKTAGSKNPKAAGAQKSKKAQSDKTPSLTNPNAVGALRMRDEKPSATREEPSASSSADYDEAERLANLEAAKAENAKHNLELAERQRMLQDRRAKGKEDGAMARAALLKRQETWLERAFNASLVAFDPSQQVSLSELNLRPDFDSVCGILRTAGCYIDTNIHGNEKFVARWTGADGKNHMAWGDRPHGAQLNMGIAAGWFKSLVKALRESGMLAS